VAAANAALKAPLFTVMEGAVRVQSPLFLKKREKMGTRRCGWVLPLKAIGEQNKAISSGPRK
jgi:hypothetical protein